MTDHVEAKFDPVTGAPLTPPVEQKAVEPFITQDGTKPEIADASIGVLYPVVALSGQRTADEHDVIIDNVIVGRHSDLEVREAIAATNKPLLEQLKTAIAPI